MRFAAALAALLAAWIACVPSASAQDAAGAGVEIDLRRDVTPFDPGKPVTDGFAAYVEDGWGPAEAARAAVAADASGRVRLPFRGPGGTVLAWAPGRAPVGVRVNAPIGFVVPLVPSLDCDVRVVTASGAAISQAEVTAEALLPLVHAAAGAPEVHRVRAAARTAGDGRARFPGMAEVPLSVTVRAEGFTETTVFPVDPRNGATIVLGRGSRVSGALRLLPDGAPARGATARLGPRTSAVREDGTFAFDTVPPGAWELRFEGTGFAAPAPRTIVLEDGVDRGAIDVVAQRTSTLPGRVALVPGERAPPLVLTVSYPPSTGIADVVRSALPGADGAFTATELPPCDGVVVTVAAPGRVAARIEGISLPPGEVARALDVALAPGAAAEGVLTGLDGTPLADTVVAAVQGPPPFRREWSRTRTGPDGAFALDGLPAGEAWLRVVGRPAGAESALGPFRVSAGARTALGTLRVFAGHVLRGRAPGAPEGAVVVASRDGAETGRAPVQYESFEIAGLPAGTADLRVEAGGETVGAASASLPAAWPVTVACSAASDVRGRLTDESGRPVAAATLRAERLDGDGRRALVVRHPDGAFELRLARGRWRVAAEDGAGASASAEFVVPDDTGTGLSLVLETGASARGVVVAAEDGRPLEGSVVSALSAGDGRRLATALADATGRFALTGIPEGVVLVRVETPDRGASDLDTRALRRGDDADFGRVEVPRGTRVQGEVAGAGGSALAGAEVSFECDSGTRTAARTDVYGRFSLAGLPRGGAVLRVRAEDGTLLRSERVEVPWAWDEWRLRIDVSAGTAVRGRVRTGGRPDAFARVTLRTFEPAGAEVRTVAGPDGDFALPPVAPGVGEIEVTVAGAASPWRRPVRVRGGTEQREDLDLPEATVAGRAEAYEGGQGIAGAVVELRDPAEDRAVASAVTQTDGSFVLERVPPGAFDLVATRGGYGPAWLRAVDVRRSRDVSGLRVVLPPEGRLALRATDARHRPVTSAWVRAWPAAPGGSRQGPGVAAHADASGRIVLRGVARGGWRVTVGAPGRATVELGVLALDEGDRDAGDVVLEAECVVEATAMAAGRPLPGIEVTVRDVYGLDPRAPRRPDDPLAGPDPAWVTGSDGRVVVAGLAPGTYRLFPAGRPDADVRVRLRGGAVVRLLVPVPMDPPGPPGPDEAPPEPGDAGPR